MGALLWDIKEVQSLVILERMSSLMTSHFKYLMLLVGGLILGGLIAMLLHRKKEDYKENITLFQQKRNVKSDHLRFRSQDYRNLS